MCSHFTMLFWDDLEALIKEVESHTPFNIMPDWPARSGDAYPKSMVPLIVSEQGKLRPTLMRWGYEVTWDEATRFNTRADTALGSPNNMWHDSLEYRRCIVPAFCFYEPHHSETCNSLKTGKSVKQQYRFTMADSQLLFMAGIYENGCFSLMTTEPNKVVRPVHDRMPVVLAPDEFDTWFTGNYTCLFDRADIPLIGEKATEGVSIQATLF